MFEVEIFSFWNAEITRRVLSRAIHFTIGIVTLWIAGHPFRGSSSATNRDDATSGAIASLRSSNLIGAKEWSVASGMSTQAVRANRRHLQHPLHPSLS
jgi:hypothetical protein